MTKKRELELARRHYDQLVTMQDQMWARVILHTGSASSVLRAKYDALEFAASLAVKNVRELEESLKFLETFHQQGNTISSSYSVE